ncbi:uncharacterized protein EV420DRAFT_1558511 [Desarmillaria tabescens]|uniref:F-box domain-containing protein n=1 Tax=Armillaria tabescens TaxID=1929756 RepID=A0AA39K1U0_ARMTA|nr:uncharacterized protein EV420DRAFT_1558511 [Desarmillaria tabescens]KAK0452828.1 hypothetical protein EV420DRAFT_1558511 [Desarmillaria tabescens]
MPAGRLYCTSCTTPYNLTNITSKYGSSKFSELPAGLTRLLQTNEPPPYQDLLSHRTSLKLVHDVLSDIDDLKAWRERIVLREQQYQSLLSPARRLPNEILREIFLCTKEIAGEYDLFDTSVGPWVLGAVCQSWRYVSTTKCPEIWTGFGITVWGLHKREPRAPVSLLKTAIGRTGNKDIDFSFDCILVETCNSNVSRLFFEVLQESPRWAVVRLFLHKKLLSPLRQVVEPFSRLSALAFGIKNLAPIDNVNLDVFEDCPNLSVVHLLSSPCPTRLSIPYSQLTSFSDIVTKGTETLHAHYLDIIRQSPHLRTISLPYSIPPTHPFATPAEDTRIIHNSIQELSIAENLLFVALQLPQLTILHVGTSTFFNRDGGTTLTNIAGMLEASKCSLTELSLTNIPITHNILAILQLSPLLSTLKFLFTDWCQSSVAARLKLDDLLIKLALYTHGSGYNFVPQLETFDVSICEEHDLHVGFISPKLVDMVLSRCLKHDASPLKGVNVNISVPKLDEELWYMNTDRMQELRECGERGVTIDLAVQDNEKQVWKYV